MNNYLIEEDLDFFLNLYGHRQEWQDIKRRNEEREKRERKIEEQVKVFTAWLSKVKPSDFGDNGEMVGA
jgi:hypothetical protein